MEIVEIRQGIALLPPTAQTKPLLDAMLTWIEDSQSNALDQAAGIGIMRQELDARKATELAQSQGHPRSMCEESSCGVCVAQAEAIVALGRGQVQSDIDTALMWAGGPAWQEKIAGVVGKWIAAGRPQPGDRPAFDGDVIE